MFEKFKSQETEFPLVCIHIRFVFHPKKRIERCLSVCLKLKISVTDETFGLYSTGNIATGCKLFPPQKRKNNCQSVVKDLENEGILFGAASFTL